MNQENSSTTIIDGEQRAQGTPSNTSVPPPSTPGACYMDKSEKKREASSLIYDDADSLREKKTRHYTGDLYQLPEGSDDRQLLNQHHFETDVGIDIEDDSETLIHVLPQPINPNDIVQIASVQDVTKTLKGEINKLQKDMEDLQVENADLRKTNDDLETRLSAVEYETDSLEQYSRRNSLRISGIPEEPGENTDQRVIQLAGGLGVNPEDIDRSHRIGKLEQVRPRVWRGAPRPKRRPRDILVKFARYNARDKLYQECKDLRNLETHANVFINEDLTKKRSKLLFDGRTLARAEIVKAAYSTDWKLYIRDHEDNRHMIKSDSDIKKFGNVEEAKKIIDRMRLLKLTSQFTSNGATGGAHGAGN